MGKYQKELVMRIKFIITTLFILLFSCGELVQLDEGEVILLDSEYNQWLEKEYGYKSWQPKQDNLAVLEKVVDRAIEGGEFYFLHKPQKKSIDSFYRQYVPYINAQNQRIIRINAFCEVLDVPPVSPEDNSPFKKMDWKNQYVEVEDGGSCYWRMDVNIDKMTYKPIAINEPAPPRK
ncbi:hypothetical protein [Aquimarina macrocephali]|uniref:hypothetical protein n=1 Tax=Aquimarina macrocephali TaxID=666563 RepID=UPI000462F467|nr:hypothetical protein [Aquimarina macrocephali]